MKTERGSSFTLNKLFEKEIKNLEILGLIRKKGSISRAEISKFTGINIVSICSYIKNYIDNNIISESGFDVSTGGRKPELVELNAKENFVIGLNITPSEIKGVVADLAVNVIKKENMPVAKADVKDSEAACLNVVRELFKTSGLTRENVKAIGAGISGSHSLPLENITQEFGAKTFSGNAAVCGACGEKYLNPQLTDSDSFIYIFSSLGIGVLAKREDFFEDSSSEEMAYLRPWDESLGIVGSTVQEIKKGIGTMIVDIVKADVSHITEETVLRAAKENDEVAMGIIQSVAANLGIRIAYLINSFNPPAVVIGGGLENAGQSMLDGIRRTIKKMAVKKMTDNVKVIPAIMGEDAVSIGAASLAVREIFLRI